MSSAVRNAEKKRERELEWENQEIENSRVQSLSIFERLEEATDIWELKEVIKMIAERAGLDIYE